MDILGFGTAGEIELHFAQELIVVIDEGNVDFDRLANTGIGEMLGHIFAVGFVGPPFADLGQIVLTIGVMDVGSELGALAGQMTAPAEQITSGAHL